MSNRRHPPRPRTSAPLVRPSLLFRKLHFEPLEDRRLLAVDFGDAPDPYPTALVDNGARHEAIGPTLGALRDEEADGQPSSDANGDGADEDGVTFGSIRVGQLDATLTVNIQNAPNGAKLDAWIDFNGDGSWGGPGERIAASVSLVAASNTIEFDVPSGAISGDVYARFRLSTDGNLGPSGAASDGEVEDYRLTVSAPARADTVFTPHVITNGVSVNSVYAADLDGDGDMDVLSASSNSNTVAWHENDGSGSFTERTITTTAMGAFSVFAADVDGDGDTDVLSASRSDNTIAWHENDGDGNFTSHDITTTALGANSVYAADLDGDGDLDVLSASLADDTIAWYENDGDENFTVHIITITHRARSVFAADLDGDGHLDVLITSLNNGAVAWHKNDGRGNISSEGRRIAYPAGRGSIYVADLDNDGDPDILTQATYGDRVAWYENDGVAGFTPHLDPEAPSSIRSAYAADMDGDGDLDVLASGFHRRIFLRDNDGNGEFTNRIITAAAAGGASVHAADLDGDGDLDILSSLDFGAMFAWYENVAGDFGDAPAPYPTGLPVGAMHPLRGPRLGDARDSERDGQPSAAADGDGDDGVTLQPVAVGEHNASITVNVQNAPVGAVLDAWIDFDGDGVWGGALEQIAENRAVFDGDNTIAFDVPLTAAVGTTYARFRVSTAGGLSPSGPADDGEVEDYQISVTPFRLADLGDAPAPYPTRMSELGAVHIGSGPMLGATRDVEPDGQPTDAADGDGADEDGVAFGVVMIGQADSRVTVSVQGAPDGAKLDAWIDFNGDGAWDGASEQIAVSLNVTNGDNPVVFSVPLIGVTGTTYARFRLSTVGDLAPTGPANDGEVEDYLVTILPLDAADFGDAPAPYPTRLANSGAVHRVGGPTLGAARDLENDGQPSAAADGDVDDDGVTFGAIRVGQLGASVTVNVENAPNGAMLDAWVDFNGDGSWGGSDEHIAAGVRLSNGDNKVRFDVPSGAISGEVYARFRISTAGDLGIGGVAADGEVEDYRFTIDPPAPASGSFVAKEIGPGSADASLVVVADIDGDGAMDVITADQRYGNTIVWYQNLGGGNFAQRTIAETGGQVLSFIVTDIDGDGDLDVIGESDGPRNDDGWTGNMWYEENDGTGEFTEHIFKGGKHAFSPTSLAAADIDGDGDMDLVRATSGTTLAWGPFDPISWFENDGSEQFTEHYIDSQTFGHSVAIADVEGDGDLDILSTSLGLIDYIDDPGVYWFENNGSQSFSGREIATPLEHPGSVVVADIDGDGKMDVLSADGRNGGIALNAGTIITNARGAYGLFAADVDGDGDLDVIGGAAWYENIDGREFTRHDVASDFIRSRVVAAADMDGDGDLDLIGTLGRNGPLVWFENLSPQPPPADLTGNGFVDFEDLTVLLSNWNQNVSAEEGNLVDAGGTPVNFEDLTVLLAAWTGPGAAAAAGAAAVRSDRLQPVEGDRINPVTTSARRAAGDGSATGVASYRARREALRSRPTGGIGRLQAVAVDRALEEELELRLARRRPAFARRGSI